MRELHSRHGDERPGRPCPLTALSGRRAAQDGPRYWPGGLDRADARRLGESLSAGQVAAPDQPPGEGLGRGHSAARVGHGEGASAQRAKPAELLGQVEARPCERAGLGLFQAMARAVVVLGLLVGPATAADTFVKPGDEGTIEFPLENDSTSGRAATGVQLTLRVEPASMAGRIQFGGVTVKEDSNAALPITIAVGQTRTLVVSYSIPSGVDDGSFQVFLDASIPDQVVDPDPATWNTSVIFGRFGPAFLDDRLG